MPTAQWFAVSSAPSPRSTSMAFLIAPSLRAACAAVEIRTRILFTLPALAAASAICKQFAADRGRAATWKSSAPHRGLLQAYLAWGDAINGFIEKTSLSDVDKARTLYAKYIGH